MPKAKYEIIDKDGKVVPGTIVPDGGRVRTTFLTMDAATVITPRVVTDASAHGARSLPITDADRAKRTAMYAAADAKLSVRWKDAPPLPPSTVHEHVALEQVKTAVVTHGASPDALAAAYARRDLALTQRWKGAAA